jgi:hypothetical protein
VFLPQLVKYQRGHGIAKAPEPTRMRKGFQFDCYIKSDFEVDLPLKGNAHHFRDYTKHNIHLDKQPTTLVVQENKAKSSYKLTDEVPYTETVLLSVWDPEVSETLKHGYLTITAEQVCL